MYKAYPFFSLKNLGKKVHIIHGKVSYLGGSWVKFDNFLKNVFRDICYISPPLTPHLEIELLEFLLI